MKWSEDDKLLNDPFLEGLIPKLPLERTSFEFTNTVMNQVYASVEPEIDPVKYRRQMLWAYGLIGAGIVLIVLVFFAVWPFINFNLNLDSINIISIIKTSLVLFDKMSQIGTWIGESTIPISIFFSILVLFLFERILRTKVSGTKSYML